MATHIMLTNKEGGYFYRFYPKLAPLRFNDENKLQKDLFNPAPNYSKTNVMASLHGMFKDKYNDNGLIVEFHSQCTFFITDNYTGQQEERTLNSKLLIHANDHIYNYPFEVNKIYCITVNEITEI